MIRFNDIFQDIFVINLDKDTERWGNTYTNLFAHDITQFERFPGVVINNGETVKDRENGCKQSHLNIIRLAKEKNYPYVCIFEDDIGIRNDLINYLPIIKMFIEKESWEMFYFGCNYRTAPLKSGYPNIDLLPGGYTTHAYVVHSSVYDLILNNGLDNQIDVIYSKIVQPRGKCFCTNPRLMYQKSGYSVIQDSFVDYKCLKDPD